MRAQAGDINTKGAYNGTSMDPERRERQDVADYLSHMREVEAEFDQWRTDENDNEMDEALEKYQAGYVKRMNAYLGSHSGIHSQFITGASGWTDRMIRSQQRKNETTDNRVRDLVEYSDWKLGQLRRRFNPRLIAKAPISSDNPEAVNLLQGKIDKLKRRHEGMKAANRIIKGKGTDAEKVAKICASLDISEETAWKILEPDFAGRAGFPAYELQNNNANIKRMERRIKQLEANAERPSTETQVGDVIYRENTEANRVQIVFPGKPDADTRSLLKARGFRWTPSQKAWQRQLTDAGICAGQYIMEHVGKD